MPAQENFQIFEYEGFITAVQAMLCYLGRWEARVNAFRAYKHLEGVLHSEPLVEVKKKKKKFGEKKKKIKIYGFLILILLEYQSLNNARSYSEVQAFGCQEYPFVSYHAKFRVAQVKQF